MPCGFMISGVSMSLLESTWNRETCPHRIRPLGDVSQLKLQNQSGRNGSENITYITPSQVKPALLTMIWIFPPPNSAAFLTSSSIYCAFNISPGTAIAFPPASLMPFATVFAFAVH